MRVVQFRGGDELEILRFSAFSKPADDAICLENALGHRPINRVPKQADA